MKRRLSQNEGHLDDHALNAEIAAIVSALNSDSAFTEKVTSSPIFELSRVLNEEGFAGDAISQQLIRLIDHAIADQADKIRVLDTQQVIKMSLSELEAEAPTLIQQIMRDIQALDSTQSASVLSVAGGGFLKTWKRPGDRTPTMKWKAGTADVLELLSLGLLGYGVKKGIEILNRPKFAYMEDSVPKYIEKPVFQEYEAGNLTPDGRIIDNNELTRHGILYNIKPAVKREFKNYYKSEKWEEVMNEANEKLDREGPFEPNPAKVRFNGITQVKQLDITRKLMRNGKNELITFRTEVLPKYFEGDLRPPSGDPGKIARLEKIYSKTKIMPAELKKFMMSEQDKFILHGHRKTEMDGGNHDIIDRNGRTLMRITTDTRINNNTTNDRPAKGILRSPSDPVIINKATNANPRRVERIARTDARTADRKLIQREPNHPGVENDGGLIRPARPHIGQSLDVDNLGTAADREANQLISGSEAEIDSGVSKVDDAIEI